MKTISMSRNVFVKNEGWTRINLNDQETKDVLGRVRWLNVGAMEQCLKDAELLGKMSPTNKVRVAIALFEKVGLHNFTAFREELDNKAHQLRNSKQVIASGGDR